MYLIRETRKEDLPNVLLLIHEFQAEALDSFNLFCDDDKAVKLMEAVWHNSLVMEAIDDPAIQGKIVGVIAGMIGSAMVSTDPVMQELIWFVSKGYRKYGCELLKRFEQLARDRGCKQILMVHLGTSNRDIMERYYTRQGYKLLELQYIKCL